VLWGAIATPPPARVRPSTVQPRAGLLPFFHALRGAGRRVPGCDAWMADQGRGGQGVYRTQQRVTAAAASWQQAACRRAPAPPPPPRASCRPSAAPPAPRAARSTPREPRRLAAAAHERRGQLQAGRGCDGGGTARAAGRTPRWLRPAVLSLAPKRRRKCETHNQIPVMGAEGQRGAGSRVHLEPSGVRVPRPPPVTLEPSSPLAPVCPLRPPGHTPAVHVSSCCQDAARRRAHPCCRAVGEASDGALGRFTMLLHRQLP
jgi:hypothetical protein